MHPDRICGSSPEERTKLWLVWALPFEPTTEVGLDWKRGVRERNLRGAVCGIGNGWLRYLPHPRDLEEPLAHQRYEVFMSLLAPPACERLLEAGTRLLDGLLEGS